MCLVDKRCRATEEDRYFLFSSERIERADRVLLLCSKEVLKMVMLLG